ncbi:MAG: helix-turn-helix domain-containing protein [Wujia sp.]
MEVKIGTRLARLRAEQGMTQEEFANRIGISRQAVSKYELDKSYPDLDKLVSIANLFQVSTDYLLLGECADTEKAEENTESDETEGKKEAATQGIKRINKIGLCTAGIVSGVLLLFFLMIFCEVLFRKVWDKKDEDKVYAKIEQVYSQYTKADIFFVDDDLKQVQRTVWLDEEGVRAGDYVLCYTNERQDNVYMDYGAKTLIVPGVITIALLLLFVIILIEIKRIRNLK